MTMVIDGSNGLTYPNSSTQASSSVVLQVVNATYATQVSTISGSAVATGLTASITPKFSNSKILVLAGMGDQCSVIQGNGVSSWLYRNGSAIGGAYFGSNQMYTTAVNSNNIGASQFISYLDNPATTSSTTYAIYFASKNASNTVTLFRDNTIGTITLMEIAA